MRSTVEELGRARWFPGLQADFEEGVVRLDPTLLPTPASGSCQGLAKNVLI